MQGMLSQEQHLPANLCHRADGEEPLFVDLFINDIDTVSPVVVKGRLRANLKFWQDIGASKWIIDIISLGYCLPFVQEPDKKIFNNHASALRDSDFVSKENSKLLKSGALLEVNESDLTVCSPLGVTRNACGKQRLILDLRYVNQHLRVSKFKYEDIRTACDLFSKGDWFFKFDYTSGYHHVEIHPEHTTFLGCSWSINGKQIYLKFTVLPFGLASAPFVFTKIQRVLVSHWRRQGIRIFTYLDDGAGAEGNLAGARVVSKLVQQDITASGFVANDEKCQWEPTQCGELLGFVMDLASGLFTVPERRVATLQSLLQHVLDNQFVVSACHIARIAGCLVSMGLALGPVVRLWTRECYRVVQSCDSWDKKRALPEEAHKEIQFWSENFENDGQPIWRVSPKVDILTFSDASNVAWGGYAVQLGDQKAVGSWSAEESVKSSTFREIKAARLVLESLAPQLVGKEIKHRTDNQGTERIMSVGSKISELHDEAVLIYKLCKKFDIRLSVEWVCRDSNKTADDLSRLDDPDDYMLDPVCFRRFDTKWGPHTIDRFASMKTTQLPRFCSKYLNPGCECFDAFTVSWAGENNWLFPPPYLIPRVLRHMCDGREKGTLIAPSWPSAPWWPLLVTRDGTWQPFVRKSDNILAYSGIFLPGSSSSNIFTDGKPAFDLIALQLDFG